MGLSRGSGLWNGAAGLWSGAPGLYLPSGAAGPGPSMPFPALSITPTVRLHSQQSTIVQSGGRATSISDVANPSNPPAVNTTGAGPLYLTDDGGWPFFQFNGTEYLSGGWTGAVDGVGGTGVAFDVRNFTVIIVGQMHKSESAPLVSLGNIEQKTTGPLPAPLVNPGSPIMRLFKTGDSAAFLASQSAGVPSYASNRAYMFPGSEFNVCGVSSGPSSRIYAVNDKTATEGSPNSNTTTGVRGYEIGRTTANGAPGLSGSWARLNAYDIIIYSRALSESEMQTVIGELRAVYGITATIGRYIWEGDSITDGFGGGQLSGNNPTMQACRRGNPASVMAGYNVLNIATAGNTITDLIAQRDATDTIFAEIIPGGVHIVGVHGGTNDIDNGDSAATTYGRLVALLNTPTSGSASGYLQRGWRVFVDRIIAYRNPTFQAVIETYRGLVDAPTFLTDTLSGAGQAFEGSVTVVDVAGYQVNGQTIFSTLANAGNDNNAGPGGTDLLIYIAGGDVAHLRALGNQYFAGVKVAAVRNAPAFLRSLSLSGSATQGIASTINIANATSGSTITVVSGSLPAGMTLNSGARTITGTPSGSGLSTFSLREVLAGAANTPRDTAGLEINVAAAPTLGALSLSASSVTQGASSTINIVGATTGSAISLQSGSLPAGMTLNSGARTISGTPTTISSNSFTLRETLAGATNTPNDTPLSLNVVSAGSTGFISSGVTSAGSGASVTIAVPAGAQSGDLLLVWGVTGTGAEYQTPAGWTQHLSSSGFTIHTLPSWDGSTANYTFTTTGSTSSPQALAILVYRGRDFNDVGTLSAATAGSVTPATLTVTENGSINLTLAGGVGASRTFSMTTGWTSRADNATSRSLNVFERDATVSAGSLAGVAVTGSSGNNRVVQIALGPR